MKQIVCPECQGEISFSANAAEGEVVSCPECTVDLEVVSVKPLKVELAPEAMDDWGE